MYKYVEVVVKALRFKCYQNLKGVLILMYLNIKSVCKFYENLYKSNNIDQESVDQLKMKYFPTEAY